MSALHQAAKPSPRRLQLRDILGHQQANCFSCETAHRDYATGEMGESDAEYRCPFLGADVDPHTEKGCWKPEFWRGFADKLNIDLSVEGADLAAQRAHAAFVSAFMNGKH